ncbi:MAG: peptidylprolyl isomerase [Planctomycetaceae bacterium]
MSLRYFPIAALLTFSIIAAEPAIAQDSGDKAPETFKVLFETSQGNFTVEVQRKWAPIGADRFHELVKQGFFNEARFFRVVPNFMVQFGINGDPAVQKDWRDKSIKDDPVVASNQRGFITFAKTNAPNSRTTQLFINFKDNSFLDNTGFAPFGRVIEGMEVVDKINAEYREQPDQGLIQKQGNRYLNAKFPRLDFIKSAKIVEE